MAARHPTFNRRLLGRIGRYLAGEELLVEEIMEAQSVETLLRHVEWNLRHCRHEGIVRTLTFLRDASLFRHPMRDLFRQHLGNSGLWDSIRELLYHRHHNVRGNTVYTIGKLHFRNRAKLLRDAFPHYFAEDPINLGRLMFELHWLTRRCDWKRLDQIVAAPHYLQRWSLCSNGYVPLNPRVEDAQRFLELYRRLAQDPHPLVAANAEQLFNEVQTNIEYTQGIRPHSKRTQRALNERLEFEAVMCRFMGNRQTYTLSQLDRFVRSIVADRTL